AQLRAVVQLDRAMERRLADVDSVDRAVADHVDRHGPAPGLLSVQRPCSDRTLSPKVQLREPSQFADQVIRPLSWPLYVFHACATRFGARYPPPAPGWAGRPGTCLSYGTRMVVPCTTRPEFRQLV